MDNQNNNNTYHEDILPNDFTLTESFQDLKIIIKLVIDDYNGEHVSHIPYLTQKNNNKLIINKKNPNYWMNQYINKITTRFIS